jgi:hypothetical protein
MAKTARTGRRVAETSVESSASAVEWAAITAGALGAIGITVILLAFGSGAGIAVGRPWAFNAPAPEAFGFWVATGMIVTQWLASAVGGYLSGRLREKWVGIRTDEVFFRDTAHGFLAWATGHCIDGRTILRTGVHDSCYRRRRNRCAHGRSSNNRCELFPLHRAFVSGRGLHRKRCCGVGRIRPRRNVGDGWTMDWEHNGPG